MARNAARAATIASAGIVPGQIESNKYSLGADSKGRSVLYPDSGFDPIFNSLESTGWKIAGA